MQNHSFGGVCFVKEGIMEILANLGFETTVLDGDTVFLGNPIDLFMEYVSINDFVCQLDNVRVLEVDRKSFLMNIGVFSSAPSEMTLRVLRVWRERMRRLGEQETGGGAVDQDLLQMMLYSGRLVFNVSSRQMFSDPAPEMNIGGTVSVGFYSGWKISHLGQLPLLLDLTLNNRNLTWRPLIFHTTWLFGAKEKSGFMKRSEYPFADERTLNCRTDINVSRFGAINWERFAGSKYGSRLLADLRFRIDGSTLM
jgi:hypothetical protein